MIRVLDDNGEAVGAWAGALTAEELRKGLRDMMLTARLRRAHAAVAAPGQDVVLHAAHRRGGGRDCAIRQALEPGDMNFPTYRQQGLLIACGWPLVEMMNQIFSNEKDPLKGRQLPGLYSSKEPGFFSISGNLGTQYPRRSAGRWPRRSRATRASPRAGSATARRRRAIFMPRWCSPPSIARR